MTIRNDIVELIPALRAYAWVLTRRHEDVDDLVQDTLVKAIAKVGYVAKPSEKPNKRS